MKCAICNNKTTWDESYGRENFLVCPKCFYKLKKATHQDNFNIFNFIIEVGWLKEEEEEKTK